MSHEIPTFEAQLRDRLGSRYSERLRETGRFPAVLYGHGQEPRHIHLDTKSFAEALAHEVHLINVSLDGKAESCLIKDVQLDHLGRAVLHVDLTLVDLGEEVEVEVELVLTGEPKTLEAAGAVLDHPQAMLTVKCRADAIPEHLEQDISALTTETPMTVADMTLPEGVVVVDDPETVIATISIVQEVEEEAPEEAEGAEPEVMEKGKKEEDEAEA